jgi:uncharacterized membrane protein YvbJ
MMFCPFCGRQNKDNAIFCTFCSKALPQKTPTPQKSTPQPATSTFQPSLKANPIPVEYSEPKPRLSYNAKRFIVTALLITGIVVVIILIYYPNVFSLKF